MEPWHQIPADAVLGRLRSSRQGLSAHEVQRRLAEYGPNAIASGARRTMLGIVLGQFSDFMILVLLAAAIISGAIGEVTDSLAIVAILVLNGAIGAVQEFRAERAIQALQALAAPHATVLRDGMAAVIAASEVVPGDVVLIDAGAIVPADLRLLEVGQLRVDEAALTGESVPVEKVTDPIAEATLPLGDRRNMAYKGTVVTYGRGVGVAVATGMQTEFGKIAALLQEAGDVKTPLQRRLAVFGRRLSLAALVICAIVFIAGLMRGEAPLAMFLIAVSLAVAAVPEALPAVVTISLALGARRMVRTRALVRKLPAVETLGSVTYICADKTGTLTKNQMRVEEFYGDGGVTRVPARGRHWDMLLRAMALSNDADIDGMGRIVGDPTEAALFAAAREAGVDRDKEEETCPRVAEIPFDADRKCMTTFHRDPAGGVLGFTKGAFEVVLGKSVAVLTSTGRGELRSDDLLEVSRRMAADGLRVLAFGMRQWPALPSPLDPETVERELTFLGFVGLIDPPREEVGEAVATCKTAGIVPVMVTGDHPVTAAAIAKRLGIVDGDGNDVLLTGHELAALSQEELELRAERIRIYARMAPDQKLKIVRALQARGQIVAMTGDGVNDAPALRQADIGVAMGNTGTDVAKEASSMILLDDNFATIVRAVREGRKIYDNLRRFIRYALATNSGEIWTIFLAPFFGLPMPLLPVQILWINLVTDGLPGLALAVEPEERDVMRRPPRPPGESVLARGLGVHVVWVGLLMATLAIGVQAWAITVGSPRWQTMVFTILCLSQLANVLAVRSERESLFTQGLLSNRPLLGAVVLAFLLQLATVYLPVLNPIFRTRPLTFMELTATVAISTCVFLAVEAEKWWERKTVDSRGVRRR